MTDDEKKIEEMAKIINNPMLNYCRELNKCKEICQYSGKSCRQYTCRDYAYAETLHKAGYQKLPEDSIVLTREEYEKLKNESIDKLFADEAFFKEEFKANEEYLQKRANRDYIKFVKKQERKETAEKFVNLPDSDILVVDTKEYGEIEVVSVERLQELAKELGVEIKES